MSAVPSCCLLPLPRLIDPRASVPCAVSRAQSAWTTVPRCAVVTAPAGHDADDGSAALSARTQPRRSAHDCTRSDNRVARRSSSREQGDRTHGAAAAHTPHVLCCVCSVRVEARMSEVSHPPTQASFHMAARVQAGGHAAALLSSATQRSKRHCAHLHKHATLTSASVLHSASVAPPAPTVSTAPSRGQRCKAPAHATRVALRMQPLVKIPSASL